ncbi:3-hydroxyisobutyrate dehydrogenase, mitochondrial [Acipenser ruthenus]|uniref:3-hydroxyisobutyrate dehydrogenase, mitochondrial n=1 Tax=Acipenser ruthenus TaxID=7906 RepID=A0A444UID7_ACIRT|nr:3-hydroxyisobutyrate dehydrogenase, mitochondrial [Acipenser ruthenus]
MASKTPVGFIGLGNMGSHMAKNLLKHGYPVFASDIFPESCKEIQDLGAQVLDSPAEVADRADRIITMLPSSPNVIEVYTGLKGILKKVKKGSLLIDSSTIDPSVSKKMAKEAEKMGAVFMDAPVSGVCRTVNLADVSGSVSPEADPRYQRKLRQQKFQEQMAAKKQQEEEQQQRAQAEPTAPPFEQRPGSHQQSVGAARSGKLTFMVGGVEEEFTAVQELLTCMGTNVVYCGEVGTGQAAKICNNMLLAISMIGTAETMNLGIRLGLDPKLLSKILNMSSGRCWSSDTYNPVPGVMEGVPSASNYQGGFGTTLMAKDLGLAQDTATNTKTAIPLGSLSHQIYRVMCARGFAQKDFSSVFQFLREEENQ